MHLIICCLKDNHGRKCMYGHYTWKSIDKPGKVANPARWSSSRVKHALWDLERSTRLTAIVRACIALGEEWGTSLY